jgi:hypothetical protein
MIQAQAKMRNGHFGKLFVFMKRQLPQSNFDAGGVPGCSGQVVVGSSRSRKASRKTYEQFGVAS